MTVRLVLAGALMLAVAAAALPARADKAAGDACAARLPTPARAIYNASAPLLVKGADGRAVVTEQTRRLVIGGQVSHLEAQEMAMAAATCLMKR